MKRMIIILLAITMALGLCACGAGGKSPATDTDVPSSETPAAPIPEETPDATPAAPVPEETAAPEKVPAEFEAVGPWHLDPEKNDLEAFADLFPGYMEFGASMEIRSNGQMSWCIGAEGGYGTYTFDGSALTADLTDYIEDQPLKLSFRLLPDTETPELEMEYKDMSVFWLYGDSGEPSMAGD